MKRCGSCSDLREIADDKVCRHHISMTVEEVSFGNWFDTSKLLTADEIKQAKEACEYFRIPEHRW